MKNIKSIVTGGAGFLGSHLVEKLVSLKHEVIVLDNFFVGKLENLKRVRNKIKIIKCDISKKGNWGRCIQKADYVFHLAALADIVPSIQNPLSYFESNVTGTANLLTSSIDYKVKKFIYASSASCYGIAKKLPTKENSKLSVEYPYALTKKMGEDLVTHWSKVYNIETVSLRLFNVYGPNSRTSGTYGAMFGTFLAQKIAKKPFTIVGDGKQTRDFTFVSDVTEAMITVLQRKNLKADILNVGSGKTVSVNKIANLLGGERTRIPKRPGEPDVTFACIKKIKSKTGWKPKISIEKGIQIMLKHINDWKRAPVWTPNKISKQTKKWFYYLGKKN